MADPTPAPGIDPADDPSNPAYWRKSHPAYQPGTGEPKTQPVASTVGGVIPQGSFDPIREAEIFGNQAVIGATGLPMAIGRGALGAARWAAPSYTPDTPAIMSPEGEGGYINQLTRTGLEPQTPTERSIAAAGRGAGAGVYFGPSAIVIGGVGSGAGQGMTEAGLPPWMGQSVELGSGLLGGYTGVARGGWGLPNPLGWFSRGGPAAAAAAPAEAAATTTAPAAATTARTVDASDLMADEGSNVIPFPRPARGGAAPATAPTPSAAPAAAPEAAPAAAPAAEPALTPRQARAEAREEQLAANVARSRAIDEGNRLINTWRPMYKWLGPWAESPLTAYMYRRGANMAAAAQAAPVVSGATSTAQKILGPVAGGAMALQNTAPPGGMQFTYNPPGGQAQSQLGGAPPFLPQPLQLAPPGASQQPGQQSYIGGTLR